MKKIPGYRHINGSFGEIWLDNMLFAEIKAFEAKVVIDREDVGQAGSMDLDSKPISTKGEGTITLKHTYTRVVKKVIDNIKLGKDSRFLLVGKLADPDSYGAERVSLDNVWFNESTIMAFENNTLAEREFPFGFTPSDVIFHDIIDAASVTER